jgi:hypothetical protein
MAQKYYDNNSKRWKGLEGGARRSVSWWLSLQENPLATERTAYFRSSPANKVGVESSRLLDFLAKLQTDGPPEVKHDWRNVLVVGELKKSGQKNEGLWLQVGSAVRNVFPSQPTCRFVHAFTPTGMETETWVFDRSGPYSGAVFDIQEDPEKFIQIMCRYLFISNDELCLDTFTKEKHSETLVALPVETRGKKRKRELEMDSSAIAHQRAIVCRGISCHLAKPASATEFDMAVKFSWTSDMRLPEADLLNKANERGFKGIARVVGY